MPFITKRDLLATERCINWVQIGATTYVSVISQSGNYSRVYKSSAGGPFTQIRNFANQDGIYIFALGSTLYSIYPYDTAANVRFERYVSGTSWDSAGYINGGWDTVHQMRSYGGYQYFIIYGTDTSTPPFAVQYGKSAIYKFNDDGPVSVRTAGGGGLTNNYQIPAFDIDQATGDIYFALQDEGTGPGNAKIYKHTPGGVETLLVTYGANVEILTLQLVNGELLVLRTNNTNSNVVLSRLDSLAPGATEEVLNGTLTNGSPGVNSSLRPGRSGVIWDFGLFAYYAYNGTVQVVQWDSTLEVVTVLDPYTGASQRSDTFGHFITYENEIILGVPGKFVYLFHTDPDEPDPEPEPDPVIVEELTEEIIIEVRPAPCSPIFLSWVNSLGGVDHYAFEDINGNFETELKTRIDAEFERYVENLDTDTNATGIASKSVEKSIKLGADNLNADVFEGLKDLFTSPGVFMLINADPLTWLPVTVSPGSLRWTEKDSSIEFTIELPPIFVQRA